MRRNLRLLAHSYLDAKQIVVNSGYAAEIDWQASVRIDNLNEKNFIREFTWVVFSSGFRESVLRKKFPDIEKAFCGFESAAVIAKERRNCRERVLRAFNHPGKVDAVLSLAKRIRKEGFSPFRKRLIDKPINFLRTLPYLGPATAYHLAKNIGLDVVKPDRHLIRIAEESGFACPNKLCESIRALVGDTLAEIDIVIWRYVTLRPNSRLPNSTTNPIRQCR